MTPEQGYTYFSLSAHLQNEIELLTKQTAKARKKLARLEKRLADSKEALAEVRALNIKK